MCYQLDAGSMLRSIKILLTALRPLDQVPVCGNASMQGHKATCPLIHTLHSVQVLVLKHSDCSLLYYTTHTHTHKKMLRMWWFITTEWVQWIVILSTFLLHNCDVINRTTKQFSKTLKKFQSYSYRKELNFSFKIFLATHAYDIFN